MRLSDHLVWQFRGGALCLTLCLLVSALFAAEVMPPKPDRYFNDYAHVVSAGTAQQLNARLEEFERATSSQIVVAVFTKMQSDSSIEDYCQRVAEAWGIGQKDKKNGAALFVFVQDRRTRIEVGYGLEGVLPDAIAKRIVENEITPSFRQGKYDAGLTAGVNAILAATKGEYKGTGHTVDDQRHRGQSGWGTLVFWVVLLIIFSVIKSRSGGGIYYGGSGRRRYSGWNTGGWGGGGGGGGGGWSGGGGFSGGGGSFGGGGASGSW